jgi:hypothetical protein
VIGGWGAYGGAVVSVISLVKVSWSPDALSAGVQEALR